jgi:drug/metabolite transporter (DMT)-like permease
MKQLLIPLLFVFLWGTGFVATKFGLVYATPMAFLTARMFGNLLCFGALMFVFKAEQPNWKVMRHLFICGLMMHALYLAGSFLAVYWGMPMGLASLIVGSQPLLTALITATFLKNSLRPSQWLGLLLGLLGLMLVLVTSTASAEGQSVNMGAVIAIVTSLLGITFGTLYQKHFCNEMDMISGPFWQYFSAFIFMALMMFFTEEAQILWTPHFMMALGWSVFVISVGAMLLLMYMIRHTDATRVTSLFYLVPPVAAVFGYFVFDEHLSSMAIIGGLITIVAVILVTRAPKKRLP